jgi:predicted ester cyclase
MTAREIVLSHLRAVEAGEWEKALTFISETYTMTGAIPFPVSLFIRMGKKDAMRMHTPRKRALPDFRFNETILEESPGRVKIQVNLSGTHSGVIDYSGILRGVPVVQPTGRKVRLPSEYFEYFVENGLIVRIVARIPKDAGVKALVRAVTGPAAS